MKRNVYGMMLAKLDEFETLTPLMITPESISETEPKPSFYIVPSSSDSPPPPRRPNSGKTLIFPLNARRPPPVTLLGTPDSRLTSFENGTTKSCATIPEDDENVQSLTNDIDLISIDRVRILKKRAKKVLLSIHHMDLFQLAVPTYGPPSPPAELSQPISLVRLPKNG
ncbi:unnamed protein product [Dracunculus medinensis]|uniref:Uncharacterized protein n=1 Tax=Dracunculus medinensis TaxID=318479 RepID=A0A3P7PKI3_DRAME|nr:unnamed protein product [Dracunculus medinensis]